MLGWFIFEPITGILADRVRKKKLIGFSILFSTIVSLFYPLATSFSHFALLTFTRTSAMSLNAVSMKAMIAELLPSTEKGKTYGRYMAAVSMGGILGPVLGGILTTLAGYTTPFYISAGISCIGLAATLPLKHDGTNTRAIIGDITSNKGAKLITRTFLGILVIRGLYMINMVFRQDTLPIFLHENPRFGASETEIGVYMSITQFSSALSQISLGALTDRVGTRIMIASSLGLESLGYFTLTIATGVVPLYVLGALHGVCGASADLNMMIHLMKIMPQGKTGIVMGLYSESENVGGIIMSPIMGVIYDSMSPIFAVYIVSATLVADSALSALMTKKMLRKS